MAAAPLQTPAPEAVEAAHAPALHAVEERATDLDAGFGRAIAIGYGFGVPVIFGFVAILTAVVSDLNLASVLAVAGAVAFWIGVMGGVVAVGLWSGRHEHEIFG